jgi:hypothetical protein
LGSQGKKFVLCLTDAIKKYVVMTSIDNMEASMVVNATFEQWICKLSAPLEFVSDNGKKFCNNLAKELYSLLGIKHYGESKASEWYNMLQHCRQIAMQHNLDATGHAEQQYNKTAKVQKFH